MTTRRRRVVGLIPRVGHGLRAVGRWTFTHPQPFLVMGALALTLWGCWNYAIRCDAFRIARVSLPESCALKPPASIVGANLWTLDLGELSEQLHAQQPWLKGVRVVRQLPNTVHIEPVERVAIAQLHVDRWYPVDREGFILPQALTDDAGHLIHLTGFTRSGAVLKVGKENADGQLQLALRVVDALRRAPSPISRHVTEINVADPQQIRLVLDGATEVRCGSEAEFDAHLERLRAVLKVIARQQLAVRYIDVRFQEPVIGPRT